MWSPALLGKYLRTHLEALSLCLGTFPSACASRHTGSQTEGEENLWLRGDSGLKTQALVRGREVIRHIGQDPAPASPLSYLE